MSNKSHDPEFDVTIDVIGIVGINREEWVITDLACNLLDLTSVPLYETLGKEMINTILKETDMTTIFGTNVCLLNVCNNLDEDAQLKTIVSFDEPTPELTAIAAEKGLSIKYYHVML